MPMEVHRRNSQSKRHVCSQAGLTKCTCSSGNAGNASGCEQLWQTQRQARVQGNMPSQDRLTEPGVSGLPAPGVWKCHPSNFQEQRLAAANGTLGYAQGGLADIPADMPDISLQNGVAHGAHAIPHSNPGHC